MLRTELIAEALAELAVLGLVREPDDGRLRRDVELVAADLGVPFVDAGSNDYLGYARGLTVSSGLGGGGDGERDPEWERLGGMILSEEESVADIGSGNGARVSRETVASMLQKVLETPISFLGDRTARACPVGAGASRLLGGTRLPHVELESVLADWTGHESALLFSSGYAANVGLLSALPREGDIIFSDALNHASIIDGCRLSKARTVVYPHRDLPSLRNKLGSEETSGQRFIVSESYFSMDADTPDLPLLQSLADEFHAALIIDEAHALGIFGPAGSGLARACGIHPDITVGTLGKAVGLQGAFVGAPIAVKNWLWNRARSFVYSTGTSPNLAQRTMFHVKHIQRNDVARACLHDRSSELRKTAYAFGLTVPPDSHGPIVPLILGDVPTALRAATTLRANGILAYPIRPPTVPEGTARLRLTVSAGMSDEAFSHLNSILPACAGR